MEKVENKRFYVLTADEISYYEELEKIKGSILIGVTKSFWGYRVLWFKRGNKTIGVFIDY